MSIKDFFSAGPGRALLIIALVVCAASFYVGRGMGYDTGHAVASISANTVAEANYQEGYDDGVKAGRAERQQAAYDNGRENGYAAGHQAGYAEGYAVGSNSSSDWSADDEAQYWKGYSEGYDAGVEESKTSAGADSSPSQQLPADSGEIDPDTYKVWVSSGGDKYHTGYCGHIRNSVTKYEVTLREAWDMGKGACSDCPVPSPDDFIS